MAHGVEGCALWFDLERARRDEKRSKLSKMFSRLFKRKPKSQASSPAPSTTNSSTATGTSEYIEWSEIPLKSCTSLVCGEIEPCRPSKPSKHKAGLHEFGSSCKKFFDDIFSINNDASPKPIQETIPADFKILGDDVSMSPIIQEPAEPTKKQILEQKGFQKLAVDQWRRAQEKMAEGSFAFPPGFREKYQLIQVIGEGSFGFVMAARRLKDGREVAVKWALREKIPAKMWAFDPEKGLIPAEVHTLRQLLHPNIVEMLDYMDGGGDYVCMVTELHGTEWTWPNPKLSHTRNQGLRPEAQLLAMRHPQDPTSKFPRRPPCDLFECIESHIKLPEQTVYKIFGQLLDAVLYLRDQGLVHRDLKDENIVVDEQYGIKLVDFGSASRIPTGPRVEDKMFKQFNGTLAFAAPEIVKGHWYAPEAAEVWTLGILLFTMVFKKAPFTTTHEIINQMPKEIDSFEGPRDLADLLWRMLEKRWDLRIGLSEIQQHPWIRRCFQDNVLAAHI